MKRFLEIGAVALISAVIIISLGKNYEIKKLITDSIAQNTPFKVKIDKVSSNLLRGRITAQGITIFNPPEFKDKIFLYASQIGLDISLRHLLRGKITFDKISVFLDYINIEKNKNGVVNLNLFARKKKETTQKSRPQKVKKHKTKKENRHLLIKVLEFKLNKFTYRNYTHTPPFIIEFKAKINQQFKNVSDIGDAWSIILVRSVWNNILSLPQLNLEEVKPKVEKYIEKKAKVIKKQFKKILQK